VVVAWVAAEGLDGAAEGVLFTGLDVAVAGDEAGEVFDAAVVAGGPEGAR